MAELKALIDDVVAQLADDGRLDIAVRVLKQYDGDRKPYRRMYQLAELVDADEDDVALVVAELRRALLLDARTAGICKSDLWDQVAPMFKRAASTELGKRLRKGVG